MPIYKVTVRIEIAASSQGEALAEVEKRIRRYGTAEEMPARVVETINVKE
jgi:hypothetical protein